MHNIELEMGNNMSRNKLHQGTRELFMAYLPKLNKMKKYLIQIELENKKFTLFKTT